MRETLQHIEAEIPRLRRYARYLRREPDHADDLVQECLARAIAKIHTWQPGTNLRAWLFVILRNCHINEIRREQRIGLDRRYPDRRAGADHAGQPGDQRGAG